MIGPINLPRLDNQLALRNKVKGPHLFIYDCNIFGGPNPTDRQSEVRKGDANGKVYQALGCGILCSKGKGPPDRSLKALMPEG